MSKAVMLLEEQQKKVKEFSTKWMVAEQLKEICEAEPDSDELIATDLQLPDMDIVHAEKKIAEFAQKHKTGNCAAVSPRQAEDILREFYGLRKRGEAPKKEEPKKTGGFLQMNLEDFLG